MPWNLQRSAQWYDKEVLKYPAPMGVRRKNIVLDATNIPQNSNNNLRTVLPAGTILRLSATNTNQYVEYTGGAAAIEGILAVPVDFLAQATAASEPSAAFDSLVVFATTQIVGFTVYASALVNAPKLSTCKWE